MNINGLLYCARYAFPPNSLGYCGPSKQVDLKEYTTKTVADKGLVNILSRFETLYPYLTLIAYENNIKDPFDLRVVEAYWLGNALLTKITQKQMYAHFAEALSLKKKLKPKNFEWLIGKIPQGSLPTHSFHVLNVFTRTGHHATDHTVETMDNCRIGWGRIIKNLKFKIKNVQSVDVETQPLILANGKLALGKPIIKTLSSSRGLRCTSEDVAIPKRLLQSLRSFAMTNKSPTYISFHWNHVCDVLTLRQVRNLQRYTQIAIDLANTTI